MDYLKYVVQLERFIVLTAGTGEEALEIFKSLVKNSENNLSSGLKHQDITKLIVNAVLKE